MGMTTVGLVLPRRVGDVGQQVLREDVRLD
jgi:hypothetical protein